MQIFVVVVFPLDSGWLITFTNSWQWWEESRPLALFTAFHRLSQDAPVGGGDADKNIKNEKKGSSSRGYLVYNHTHSVSLALVTS